MYVHCSDMGSCLRAQWLHRNYSLAIGLKTVQAQKLDYALKTRPTILIYTEPQSRVLVQLHVHVHVCGVALIPRSLCSPDSMHEEHLFFLPSVLGSMHVCVVPHISTELASYRGPCWM